MERYKSIADFRVSFDRNGTILSRKRNDRIEIIDGDKITLLGHEGVAMDEKAFAAVCGDAFGAVAAQVEALTAQVEILTAEKTAVEAENERITTSLEVHATRTAELEASLAEKTEELADVNSRLHETSTALDTNAAALQEALARVEELSPVNELPKLTLVQRLIEEGLFEAFYAALGKPGKPQYEIWQASTQVRTDNKELRDLLESVGGDVDALLAT